MSTTEDIADGLYHWFVFDMQADPGHWGNEVRRAYKRITEPIVVIQTDDSRVFEITVTEVTSD